MCWGKWGQKKDLLGLAVGGQSTTEHAREKLGALCADTDWTLISTRYPKLLLTWWTCSEGLFLHFQSSGPSRSSWDGNPSLCSPFLCLREGGNQIPFLKNLLERSCSLGDVIFPFHKQVILPKHLTQGYLLELHPSETSGYTYLVSLFSLSHTHPHTQTHIYYTGISTAQMRKLNIVISRRKNILLYTRHFQQMISWSLSLPWSTKIFTF